MKKLISILFLFTFSLFIVNSQPKVTSYVDSVKNVNVNINSDANKQKVLLEDLQGELIDAQNNQTAVNTSMLSSIADVMTEVNTLSQEIEERNKTDGKLITDTFNYSPERVKQVMRKEQWLNFILGLIAVAFVTTVLSGMAGKYDRMSSITLKLLFYLLYGAVGFWLLHLLLTTIFNGDYYVIKELMNLYT